MVRSTSRRSRWGTGFRAGAAGTALVLLAVACGGGGGGDGDGGAAAPEEELGDPVQGGSVTVGLEAETNSWLPGESQPASSGYQVLYSIFDPLMARDEDGEVEPFLAESMEPNEDLTEWTLTLRPDVQFHDGTALDAQVLKTIFDEYLTAPGAVTAGALAEVSELRVDGPLTVTYVLEEANAAFPDVLTQTAGLPFSVEAAEAAGDDAGSQPVGTGPFVFDRWTRDDQLVVTRNPDYWREGLPYLDEIVFRPVPDEDARVSGLAAGDLDALMSLRGASIKQVLDLGDTNNSLQVGNSSGATIFNVLEPPLDDVRVRRAFAHAVDGEDVAVVLGDDGLVDPTTQFASTDSPWWSERVAEAWPDHDPDRAQELVDEYVADPDRSDGKDVGEPISVEYACPPDASLLELSQVIQAALGDIGVEVETRQAEQAAHISSALGSPETDPPYRGDFQANCWRVGSERDPAIEMDATFGPVAETPTNFTNFTDPELDALIEQLRTTREFEERYAIVEDIGLILADQVPLSFGSGTPTLVAGREAVKNIAGWTLPDGTPGEGTPSAVTRWGEVWLDEG